MIPSNLGALLASRRKIVEETSEVAEGNGSSSEEIASKRSVNFEGLESFGEKSSTGYTGLINQGATCYLNSLLQSIYMITPFRRSIYQFQFDEFIHGDEGSCLTRQLQKLFAMLELTERSSISTSALTKSFGWTGRDSFAQQDVNECMTVIFDFMNTQCFGTTLGDFLNCK
jgi:uncharacterized UBP type Zn finger protein